MVLTQPHLRHLDDAEDDEAEDGVEELTDEATAVTIGSDS
jgi:hypothetical protein